MVICKTKPSEPFFSFSPFYGFDFLLIARELINEQTSEEKKRKFNLFLYSGPSKQSSNII